MKTITILIIAALVASCGIPVAVVVDGHYGDYSYSSKGGLTATIHADK